MDRELQRSIKKMTEEGLDGFEFTREMKDRVRQRVTEKKKKEYRRRWYAPFISFGIVLLIVLIYGAVKGEISLFSSQKVKTGHSALRQSGKPASIRIILSRSSKQEAF